MMRLTIIIPIYNEERTLEEIMGRVFASATPGWEKEVVAVNNGSTDTSPVVLDRLTKLYPLIVIHQTTNSGKGAAVRAGLLVASGEAVIIQDADMEYSPNDYEKLLDALNPEIGAVFGSRMHSKTKQGYLHYILGAKLVNLLINKLFGSKLADVYTGYKLIRTIYIPHKDLQSNGFEFEAEITAKLLLNKVKIVEVPINYSPRSFAEGKKIRALDAIKGIIMAIRVKYHK